MQYTKTINIFKIVDKACMWKSQEFINARMYTFQGT